jgi:hypothetical protein
VTRASPRSARRSNSTHRVETTQFDPLKYRPRHAPNDGVSRERIVLGERTESERETRNPERGPAFGAQGDARGWYSPRRDTDMSEKVSRRDALRRGTALGVLAVFSVTGCSKKKEPLSCFDTSALTPTEVTIRRNLAYVDVSFELGKLCSQCQQFIPVAPNACGTCKIVKGPINPLGYCKSFVAKAPA